MKIGDVVKVMVPEVLERVGYAETLSSARDKMEGEFLEKHGETLPDFLKRILPFLGADSYKYIDDFAKLYNAKILKFGGPHRQIFTQLTPEYEGKLAKITDRYVCKTGVYERCSDGNYLTDQKTHVFFELSFLNEEDEPKPAPAVVATPAYGSMNLTFNGTNWDAFACKTNGDYRGVYNTKKESRYGTLVAKEHLEWRYTP